MALSYTDHRTNGITADTPKRIIFGAGTVHKGLKYDETSKTWNFDDTIIGATSGGSTLTITPSMVDVDVDGALVKVKELSVKNGETATLAINFIELTPELIKNAVLGEDDETAVEGYTGIQSKARIDTNDYVQNLALVGETLDHTPVIVLFDEALCTSGMELGQQDDQGSVVQLTFECYGKIDGNLEKLPYHIYWGKEETA